MWDVLFVGIRWSMSRDENILSFVLQMFFRVVSNVTLGIISGVVSFWFQVWSVITSFGPSGWAFTLFYGGCFLAGLSFVATAIGVIVGGTILGFATLNNVLVASEENRRRIGGGHQHRD